MKLPNKILTSTSENEATMYLYGYIGQEYYYEEEKKEQSITDTEFLKTLQKFEKDGFKKVNIRINSPGGSMLHMDGIISLMQSSKMDVHCWVDGMAASAAADIFLACKKENRHMAKNAKLMIHDARIGIFGNAKTLRTTADTLDKFTEAAIAQMVSDTGMTEKEVREMFYDGEDHWLTAKDCAEIGFINKVEEFEAENVPDNIEKMTATDLAKLFAEPETANAEINIFQKLFPRLFKVGAAKKTLSMNITELKKDFGTETLPEEEVVEFLKERGYEVQKAVPTPTETTPAADLADVVSKAITEATKSLQEQLSTLQSEVQKFGAAPGTLGPSGHATESDPAAGADNPKKSIEDELSELNAADGHGSPFKAHVF